MTDNDRAFLGALETCTLPNHQFRHRDHVRAAWLYVKKYGPHDAIAAMESTIVRFAAHHGHGVKFHKTLTIAWVKLVAFHERCHPLEAFDDFVSMNGKLLDKHLLRSFYSGERLFSEEARTQWVEPDLRTFPTQ